MSRIHEALKKAAQERAASTPAELPIDDLRRVEAPLAPAEAASQVVALPPETEPQTTSPADFSVEDFLKGAARQEWKMNKEKQLFSNGNQHASGTEEFRRLRSNLYQMRNKEEMHSIVVTSAMPGEGKTFVTANLTQAFARQHERRALSIDADLRLSALHSSFGAPLTPGLTEYLRGEVDETAILQRGPSDNLFLIPAGATVPNPLELIGNGRLKQLLMKMEAYFDWIVLDSPPVLPVSDASLLAEMCDGVLVVVRAESTPFDMAQKAVKQLSDRRLLGVVLNSVSLGAAYGSYYYYHARYHDHMETPKSAGIAKTKS